MNILAGIAIGMIALALLSVVALLVLFILVIIDWIIGGVNIKKKLLILRIDYG